MTGMSPEPDLPVIGPENAINEKRLNSNLEFIERQCRKAIHHMSSKSGRFSDIQLENDTIELFNRIVDLVRRDDFAFLRRFNGRSKLSTYLSAMVSRQAVDLVRRRRGRSRARERAQAHGQLGLQLFQKVFSQGMGLQSAISELLKEVSPPPPPRDRILQIADHIVGQDGMPSPMIIPMPENMENLVASGDSPELSELEQERRSRVHAAMQELDSRLTGGERFLLRLRFPLESEEIGTRPAAEIAITLGVSRKAVYRRLDRLLEKCRGILKSLDLDPGDLIQVQGGNALYLSDPGKGCQDHE